MKLILAAIAGAAIWSSGIGDAASASLQASVPTITTTITEKGSPTHTQTVVGRFASDRYLGGYTAVDSYIGEIHSATRSLTGNISSVQSTIRFELSNPSDETITLPLGWMSMDVTSLYTGGSSASSQFSTDSRFTFAEATQVSTYDRGIDKYSVVLSTYTRGELFIVRSDNGRGIDYTILFPEVTFNPNDRLNVDTVLNLSAEGLNAITDSSHTLTLHANLPLGVTVESEAPMAWLSPVPEISTFSMFAAGLVGIGGSRRNRTLQR